MVVVVSLLMVVEMEPWWWLLCAVRILLCKHSQITLYDLLGEGVENWCGNLYFAISSNFREWERNALTKNRRLLGNCSRNEWKIVMLLIEPRGLRVCPHLPSYVKFIISSEAYYSTISETSHFSDVLTGLSKLLLRILIIHKKNKISALAPDDGDDDYDNMCLQHKYHTSVTTL